MKIYLKYYYLFSLAIFALYPQSCKIESQTETGIGNPIFPYSKKVRISNKETFSSCSNKMVNYKIEFSVYTDTFRLNSKKYYKFKFDLPSSDFNGYLRKDDSLIYFVDKNYMYGKDTSLNSECVLFDFKNLNKQHKLFNLGILSGYTISLAKKESNIEGDDTAYIFSLHPIVHLTDMDYIDSIRISKKYGIQKIIMEPACDKRITCLFK